MRRTVYDMLRKQQPTPVNYWIYRRPYLMLDVSTFQDLEVEPITFMQYLNLIEGYGHVEASKVVQKKVIATAPSDEDIPTTLQTFEEAFAKLRKTKLYTPSHVQPLLDHLSFAMKFIGLERLQAKPDKYMEQLRKRFIIDFQTDNSLAFLYANAKIESLPASIFTKKNLTSLENILMLLPGLLGNGAHQASYRRLLLLYGNPTLLEWLDKQKLYQ